MIKRLKVLHVINTLESGGAENLLVNSLSPGGLQEHLDNYLIYLKNDSYLLKKVDPKVKIFNLNYKRKPMLLYALKKFRKYVKENNIDIIHSHLSPAGFYAAIAKPTNIPQVHTFHSTYSMYKKIGNNFLNYLERKFLLEKRNAQLIITSEFNKKDILKTINFKGNIYVLNNFIDDAYFNSVPVKTPVVNTLKIIAIGNLRPEKNYEFLIKIFSLLKNKNITLDIYGNGNSDNYLDLIHQYKIENIHFKGGVSNLYEVIKNYDLFIMASKFEGFPLSVFEAMVSGIPVMLSNIPVFKNLIKESALYFDLDNAEDAAKIIMQILNNEFDTKLLSQSAKKYAEKIVKRETYINNLVGIYQQIIRNSV